MRPLRLLSLLASLTLTAACRRPPPPEDPAQAAYRSAAQLFAAASAASGDLSYRDPRFDEVLVALALVPPGSDPAPKALALAARIREARARANAADEASAREVEAALAPPGFNPLPRDAKFTRPSVRSRAGEPPSSNAISASWSPAFVASKSGAGKLPDWYRQAGYLGLGQRPTAPEAPAAVAAPTDPDGGAAAKDSSTTRRRASPAPTSTPAPPAVYGLPGPAGKALRGLP